MNRFAYFNDTGRKVMFHPAMNTSGVVYNGKKWIEPMELRVFEYPKGTAPIVKMWDYGGDNLTMLIMLVSEEELEKRMEEGF
ncbi:hypothetical protein BSP36_024 [Bacillus phage BSP36]|nr:hypothetical protein BSP36_024 [Bacillus phage BSP36]